jgi:hypothetical protein
MTQRTTRVDSRAKNEGQTILSPPWRSRRKAAILDPSKNYFVSNAPSTWVTGTRMLSVDSLIRSVALPQRPTRAKLRIKPTIIKIMRIKVATSKVINLIFGGLTASTSKRQEKFDYKVVFI